MGVLRAKVAGNWVDIVGGSSGTDEVWVGTDDPIATNPSVELWVDTDDPGTMTDDVRWNTAWGIVALGTMKPGPIVYSGNAVKQPVTEALTYQTQVGRRYVIRSNVRAYGPPGPASAYMTIRRNGNDWAENYASTSQGLTGAPVEAVMDGDGVSYSWDVVFVINAAATNTTIYNTAASSYFYIEDIGPVSGSVPAPNPTPAWLPMTLINGWTNIGAPSWQTAGYRKVGDIVSLRGLITNSTTGGTFWNVPAGYGPPLPVLLSAPYAPPSQPHGSVRIDAYPTTTSAPAAPVNYLSLNGLTWSVTT
jgi:hypothetical protein